MFDFLKKNLLPLTALLFTSLYVTFIFMIGYQILNVHISLIFSRNVVKISFGIITFVISALLPIFLWKIVSDSQIPILKETLAIRLLLSELAFVFTICLFLSKSIFNSVASAILTFENEAILDVNGKIVLIEILSVAIPIILFLYLAKKVILTFIKKSEE